MILSQRLPDPGSVDLDSLLAELALPQSPLRPFADEAVTFCARLSAELFQDVEAKRYPEIVALAHSMRRAELLRLAREFSALETHETTLVPRGVVFHIPPANVDTIFVYSWLFSFLVGNRNVLRLPRRITPQIEIICRIFERALQQAPPSIRRSTFMVSYGHEGQITSALSSVADVRVIWGGDPAVSQIRAAPLPPHARELTFPDRYSLSVIRAEAYAGLDEVEKARLAEGFFNDVYWFDQAGCSSPRLLVWVGAPGDCAGCGSRFFGLLREVVERKGYTIDAGRALGKLTFAYRAILDQPVTALASHGSGVTVLPISDVRTLPREHCGAGLFFQYSVDTLEAIGDFIRRKDQTLTYFGFEQQELVSLARTLNGKGIDRIVRIGNALCFHRFWDGCDLLQELTRRVHVQAPSALR